MGEGREEDMGRDMGALPTEVGRSAAPDGVEPASPSQAKPAAANAETIARAICKSGKFETGQGTCALLCMDQLGDARRGLNGCPHAPHIHGDLAAQIVRALGSNDHG